MAGETLYILQEKAEADAALEKGNARTAKSLYTHVLNSMLKGHQKTSEGFEALLGRCKANVATSSYTAAIADAERVLQHSFTGFDNAFKAIQLYALAHERLNRCIEAAEALARFLVQHNLSASQQEQLQQQIRRAVHKASAQSVCAWIAQRCQSVLNDTMVPPGTLQSCMLVYMQSIDGTGSIARTRACYWILNQDIYPSMPLAMVIRSLCVIHGSDGALPSLRLAEQDALQANEYCQANASRDMRNDCVFVHSCAPANAIKLPAACHYAHGAALQQYGAYYEAVQAFARAIDIQPSSDVIQVFWWCFRESGAFLMLSLIS